MLSREERETVINFAPTDSVGTISTSQPEVWRKLEKAKGFKLLEESKIDGKVVSKEFEFPKSFIRFTSRGLIIAPPKKVDTIMIISRLGSETHSPVGTFETSEPSTGALPHQETEKC